MVAHRLDPLFLPDLPTLVDLRHDLHAHPEPGWREHRTRDRILGILEGLGLAPRVVAGTGLVVDTRPGEPVAVALRADMDALELEETGAPPWRSQVPGLMHACGHDGHVAILVGVAGALARARCPANVRLLFQPAEEGGAGARSLVEAGVLEGVPAIFALHNWPGLPAGRVAVRAGPVMAAFTDVNVTFVGRGGHASQPQDLVDPVLTACAFVVAAQSVVARNVHPLQPAVVSFGRIAGGTRGNIIPERVELAGTVRTLDDDVAAAVGVHLRRVAEGVAAAHGARVEFHWRPGYPVTRNGAVGVRAVRAAAAAAFGPGAVVEEPLPSMGAEDFAWYLQQVEGAYFFLGTGRGGVEPVPHAPDYDFNDDALPLGIRAFLALVEEVAGVALVPPGEPG